MKKSSTSMKFIISRLVLIVLFLILLFSCQGNDEEIQKLRTELKELESTYIDKKSIYEGRVFLLNECKRKNRNKSTQKTDDELIGNWVTPILYGGGGLRLYKENGYYFKKESFSDGSEFTSKMKMVKSGSRMVFSSLERASSDRWVVLPNGKLEVRDGDGLIYSVNR